MQVHHHFPRTTPHKACLTASTSELWVHSGREKDDGEAKLGRMWGKEGLFQGELEQLFQAAIEDV